MFVFLSFSFIAPECRLHYYKTKQIGNFFKEKMRKGEVELG